MAYTVSSVDAARAVGELVSHLECNRRLTFQISEIVKAGSLGHGTTVPGEFDIDLVLYSRDIKYEIREKLEELQHFLSSTLRGKFEHTSTTPHAVQFRYDGKIDVDLLLSPYWSSPDEVYHFLRTLRKEERFNYSSSASKWQVEFFRPRDNQVKEFIRRAKAWRNKKWPKHQRGSGRPKSYFLSVLVLRAYEKAVAALGPRASTKAMADRTTQELISIVMNHRTADIFWEDYYTRQAYSDLVPSRPRVIDPANPSNNLYKTGITRSYQAHDRAHDYEEGDGDWTEFVRLIGTIDLNKTAEEITKEIDWRVN